MNIAALPLETESEATLHAEAQKCKRLANEIFDVVVRDALIELASELEQQAERLALAKPGKNGALRFKGG